MLSKDKAREHAAILAAYGAVIWYRGFGAEDRMLFSLKPGEEAPAAA